MRQPLKDFFRLSDHQVSAIKSYEFELEQNKVVSGRAALDPSVGDLYGSLSEMNGASAIRCYLVGDRARTVELARLCISSAVTWVRFDWANHKKTDMGTIDPNWFHQISPWMSMFRIATMWASVLKDWQSLGLICAFPDDQVGMDSLDATPARRQLLIDLARLVRGEDLKNSSAYASALSGFNRHVVDKAYAVIESIHARDERAATTSTNALFAAHSKRKRDNDITETISQEGTFFLRYASHLGVKIDLEERWLPYFVDLGACTA